MQAAKRQQFCYPSVHPDFCSSAWEDVHTDAIVTWSLWGVFPFVTGFEAESEEICAGYCTDGQRPIVTELIGRGSSCFSKWSSDQMACFKDSCTYLCGGFGHFLRTERNIRSPGTGVGAGN